MYVAVVVDNHANDDELVSKRPGPVVNEDPELIEIVQYLNPTAQLVKADMLKNTRETQQEVPTNSAV
ncbi:1028_t:CDS:2, partial [Dentiscutata erythropus]